MPLRNRVLICTAIVGLTPLFSSIHLSSLQDQPQGKQSKKQVEAAIDGLWSADNQERLQAKTQLIQMGEAATPSLIKLLKDLVRDRRTRYAHLRENSTQTVNLPGNLPAPKDPEALIAYSMKNQDAVINQRLKEDVCEIFGKTKAEAAIPALIQMMWTESVISAWELFNPAMDALVTIGSPSVPKLIYAIETPEPVIKRLYDDAPDPTAEAERQASKIEVDELRVRAAMVLGKIGDKRALPVLQMSLYIKTETYLGMYFQRAIEEINTIKE